MNTMNIKHRIEVPELLLTSQKLLPSAKLVWITLLLDSALEPCVLHSRSRLARRTGLSRPTIYRAMNALKTIGWYSEEKPYIQGKLSGRTATVYLDLFLNTALSIQARLFHGLLQFTSDFKGKARQVKYSSLSKDFNMGVKTVRKSIGELARSGWIAIEQTNQLAPIFFTLRNPIEEQLRVMKARAERNLSMAKFKGEALMKEFLSTLVSTDDYVDNAKPGFLRNTQTDCLMELDRYYPKVAAFEFNGTQHYAPTELYDKETVEKQRSRDKLKLELCTDNGIELVIIHPEDLTLTGMRSKVGSLLPLRNLQGVERLTQFLERFSTSYRKNVPELHR